MAATKASAAGAADAPVIVFGHANGSPGGTYRVLFERWRAAGFEVHAIDRLGHDPHHPVRNNWRPTRDEFAAFVEQVAQGRRVHLVGHSLGGFVSLLVACTRPALAAGVVLLDSPVLAGWRAHSVQVAKATRLIGRVSPGRVSQRRRERWASADDALRHFASKHAFALWDERVLADYITAGTEPDVEHGGVRLHFRRDIETRFYNTLVTDLGTVLHRHPPPCPVGFIGGTRSVEVRQVGLEATRAVTRGRMEWLEGTHLFPMERPEEAADAVLAMIRSFAAPPPQPD